MKFSSVSLEYTHSPILGPFETRPPRSPDTIQVKAYRDNLTREDYQIEWGSRYLRKTTSGSNNFSAWVKF